MIVTNDTHTVVEKRDQQLKELERIEKLPQSQRWREIKNFLLKLHPSLVGIDREFCRQVAEERAEQLNDLGATKSNSTRRLVSLPDYLYASLKMADPEFEKAQKDNDQMKKMYHKIWDVFPEYRIAVKK